PARRADEPGDHRHDAVAKPRVELLRCTRARLLNDRIGVPERIVSDEEALSRESFSLRAGLVQHRGDDRRRDPLSIRDDRVKRSRGALPQDRHALEERGGALGEVGNLLQHVRRFEAERVGDEVPVLPRKAEDRVLGGLGVAVLGGAGGADERIGSTRCRGDDDDPFAPRSLHDLGDALQCGGRGHGSSAEFQNGPHYALRCAIWITSPSIADAVASPPAPGPVPTTRGLSSLYNVITFVGPLAWPSSESAVTSSGPTRALVAFSPKSATAR